MLEALASHLAAFPATADGLIFTNDAGRPIRRNRITDPLRTAVNQAQLPPNTRFHDLRHHYASLLIRHGESVKTVQARLGHASASETLDTYAHLWPDSEDRTREAVDLALGQAGHGRPARSKQCAPVPAIADVEAAVPVAGAFSPQSPLTGE